MTQKSFARHIVALLVWLLIFGAAYLWVRDQMQPKQLVVREGGTNELHIPRARDGHYYARGSINRHPVTFLIDTGAGTTTVGAELARTLNLPSGEPEMFNTAGGVVQGESIPYQAIAVGGIEVDGLRVVVIPQMGTMALLGQNFLRYLDITQNGDTMILKPRVSMP